MAEVFSSDNSVPTEVMESVASDIQDSLDIGTELEAAHEQKLAGKYNSPEELEKAYLELQSKLGESNKEPQLKQEAANEVDESPSSNLLDTFFTEATSGGKVSEETIKQLSKMSSLEVAKAYVEARSQSNSKELSESDARAIQDMVGGPQQYQTLVSWAQANWSTDEVQAFDNVVETGNVGAIQLALKALYYNYTDVNGVEGQTIQGKAAPRTEAFRSQAELIQAMNDPRYDDDPAYRQDVLNKLDRSNINF